MHVISVFTTFSNSAMTMDDMENIVLTLSDKEYLADYENTSITKDAKPHKHGWQWRKKQKEKCSKKNRRHRECKKKKQRSIMKDKKPTGNHRNKVEQKNLCNDWKDWYQERFQRKKKSTRTTGATGTGSRGPS